MPDNSEPAGSRVRVHVCGGLGNQMFQYAMGRALSLRLNVPLCLNACAFPEVHGDASHIAWRLPLFPHALGADVCVELTPPSALHNCLRRINIFAQTALHWPSPLFSRIVTEPYFAYWPGIERVKAPAQLHGYWQSEKYFLDHALQIRKDFAFPALPEGEPHALAHRIRACANAVSVHIRRGDYVSNPAALAFHGLPGPDYYRAALERLRAEAGEARVFLFSDDPQWVRENFDPCGHASEVVDLNQPEAPQHDMHLMALCRHHIIANSSFSWWGAWLGTSDGLTMAPRRWFADPGVNTADIYPPAWIRL